MDIKDFYYFSSKHFMTTFTVTATELQKSKNVNELSYSYRLVAGEYDNIDFPVIFKYEYGKHIRDIIDTGTAVLHLISKKLKTVLEKNKLTGWKTFPVKIYDKNDKLIPNYYGLTITGRCGPTDYSKCKTYKKRHAEHGPLVNVHKGDHVNLDTWDKTDFFLSIGSYGIIITNKVAKILKENNLTNIALQKLSEVEFSDFDIKTFKQNTKKNIARFPMNID